MTSTARFSPSLAFWSLGAPLAAVAVGVVGQATGSEAVAWLARITDPLGDV